ncbi:HAD family phosphatase [Actinocorallia sp. B10E7]|uniref:HAD family hydrolase n=1 Tax=Actinocorallia sp. B10E7 TaxID=3153558 RepID=UPI00325DEC3F
MTLRGVITDWGGVLTEPLAEATRKWLTLERIDASTYRETMRSWFTAAYTGGSAENLIHRLEDGSLEPAEFERLLAAELRLVDGGPVSPDGLLDRMFAEFAPVDSMYDVIHRCRTGGFRTALLSNSWGNTYPRERWTDLFDAIVISGEVRMRKPSPEIFHHALEVLGLEASQCVFIDDIEANIEAAESVGMVGLHHTEPEKTRVALSGLLEVEL